VVLMYRGWICAMVVACQISSIHSPLQEATAYSTLFHPKLTRFLLRTTTEQKCHKCCEQDFIADI